MKLKILASLGLLTLVSTGVDAATVYTLQSIAYTNSFAIDYRVPGGYFGGGGGTIGGFCGGCGTSTAVDDGFGNITITGAAWNINSFGVIYNTSWNATTTLGLTTALTRTSLVCVNIANTYCPGNLSGQGGSAIWYNGLGQDGVTFSQFANTDVYVSGTELYVERTTALSEANTSPQMYTLIYSTVPVPAAVWLFGSGLGLLGLARRKAKAA